MMDVRPIRTEADYDWALAEVEVYFDQEPATGSDDAARFDVLSALIEAYEAKHWAIEAPDPIDAIKAMMVELHKRQSDLGVLLGSRSRASEVLNRRRPLTMEMAWKLHRDWHVPAEALLRPMETAQ
jgi:HTH-type transcriptional regulator/antitoxin HigA